ncbi:HAMP domain-containing histidine kinase [Luteimonas sp. XNQY3]|nr:HAMP domain-containing sensor histidine kinase [Luteimonas sp. XNQY3]MCD9004755.1 HAMP domain-containing histidine kinase [Luteimonas sp. XNQY3]
MRMGPGACRIAIRRVVARAIAGAPVACLPLPALLRESLSMVGSIVAQETEIAAGSIERRIRRAALGVVVVTLLAAAVCLLIANDRLERALLGRDIQAERDFMMRLVDPQAAFVWETATVHGVWVPDALQDSTPIPALFRDRPFPFTGEAEVDGTPFVFDSSPVEGGRLYLAKDVGLYERQDLAFKQILLVMSLAVAALAMLLAYVASRRLVAPLVRLAREIEDIEPASSMARLSEAGTDLELQVVVRSFNRLLEEVESYVRREKTLLGMASHELRTPVSIVAGALDGIEARAMISPVDAKAMRRIRRAIDEMDASVDAILKLTRYGDLGTQPVALLPVIRETLDDLGTMHAVHARVQVHEAAAPVVTADPVLVKMLIRNLLHNALRHTSGAVHVSVAAGNVEISDEGPGLPQRSRALLAGAPPAPEQAATGLGLFIATLVCERLQWRLEQDATAPGGTRLRLGFAAASHAAGEESPRHD